MPPRNTDPDETPRTPPITQKQEDLLIELFLDLSIADRRKVIKFCRDMRRAAKKRDK